MKKTSFRIMEDENTVKNIVAKYLPSYTETEVEIVEEDGGYTVYVAYDDRNVKIRELEECVMHVMLLDSYLDAWNMIQEYSEEI